MLLEGNWGVAIVIAVLVGFSPLTSDSELHGQAAGASGGAFLPHAEPHAGLLDTLPRPLVFICLWVGSWTCPVRQEEADRGPAALPGSQNPAASRKLLGPQLVTRDMKIMPVSASTVATIN